MFEERVREVRMAGEQEHSGDFGAYLSESVGEWPESGVAGVESQWFAMMDWSVPTGPLLACDPGLGLNEEDALLLPDLRAGDYILEVKGMDFNGHRRIARLRIVRAGVDASALRLGEPLGEVPVDHAIFGFVDYGEVERILPKDHPDLEHLADALTEEIIGIGSGFYGGMVTLEMGKHTGGGEADDIVFPCVECGLGDGGYQMFPLLDAKGRMQGAEAEFLPPGFAMDEAVPMLGGDDEG
jgi:hypothetical protein